MTEQKQEKIGVLDVGGGVRGVYGAGIFDWCMDNGIRFDYCIGVSAGSANILSYMAGQKGRNLRFYADYAFRPQYMGWKNFFRTGSYLGLEYIYRTLTNSDGEDPLDFPALEQARIPYRIVATNAADGEPVYFGEEDMRADSYEPLMCSSCVPVVDRPYAFRGCRYYDGAIGDPIPLERAFADGCSRVVVILTRPREYQREPGKDRRMARLIRLRYPAAAARLANRAVLYNQELALAKRYEQEGKVLLLAPDSIEGMSTLTKDRDVILRLYRKGQKDAEAIRNFLCAKE